MTIALTTYAVETHGLVKEFAGFRAVNGVDLRLEAGKVHALVGPNGAGKTSLFNLLTGFLRPTAGRVVILGEDTTGLRPERGNGCRGHPADHRADPSGAIGPDGRARRAQHGRRGGAGRPGHRASAGPRHRSGQLRRGA